MPEQIAPVVITIDRVTPSAVAAMEFGPTQLRLRVLDTSLVKWAAATAMSLDGTPANVELPATNGSLTPSVNTCGELFLELWASDPAGFPVASCHYTAEYTIAGTGVREFWLTLAADYQS